MADENTAPAQEIVPAEDTQQSAAPATGTAVQSPEAAERERMLATRAALFELDQSTASPEPAPYHKKPRVQKEAAANNIGVHVATKSAFPAPKDDGEASQKMDGDDWVEKMQAVNLDDFGDRPQKPEHLKWFVDQFEVDLSDHPTLGRQYVEGMRFNLSTKGRTTASRESELDCMETMVKGWYKGHGKWLLQRVADSPLGEASEINFTSVFGVFQEGDLQKEQQEDDEDTEYDEIIRRAAEEIEGKTFQDIQAEAVDLSAIPEDFWKVPTTAIEMYDLFDYVGGLDRFLETEDCPWEDTREEFMTTSEALGAACPLTHDYMLNMIHCWDDLPVDVPKTQPETFAPGRTHVELLIRYHPVPFVVIDRLKKGAPYSYNGQYEKSKAEEEALKKKKGKGKKERLRGECV